MAVDVVSGTNFADPHDAIMKIGRNDPCPCGSGRKYKTCFTPEQTVRSCYSYRTLVNFAVFPGLAEVEPTTKELYNRHYRVRKRLLLADAVRFFFALGEDHGK